MAPKTASPIHHPQYRRSYPRQSALLTLVQRYRTVVADAVAVSSQELVAQAVGVHRNTLRGFLRDTLNVRLETLVAIERWSKGR